MLRVFASGFQTAEKVAKTIPKAAGFLSDEYRGSDVTNHVVARFWLFFLDAYHFTFYQNC